MPFDVEQARARFPSLAIQDAGAPRIHLDNPAGTQVPGEVIDAVSTYYASINGNMGGTFATSKATDAVYAEGHQAVADFLGAASGEEIMLGASMTTLTFMLSFALGPRFSPGDEIIVTKMDHDGNVTPWLMMAERHGLKVKWLDFSAQTYRYDYAALDDLITDRTRFAAVNYASNIFGTINDVSHIADKVRSVGGQTFVDAVQYAPHGPVDVQSLGADFLACSAYKFCGPHQGIIWGRRELLEDIDAVKLEAPKNMLPYKFETGTPAFELIAGTAAAVEYYASFGDGDTRQARINSGKAAMKLHEDALARRLIEGLTSLPRVRVHGIIDPGAFDERVSTVSISVEGRDPAELASALASQNIYVWSGHSYALNIVDRLGLKEAGVLRLGPVHYNTLEEMDRVVAALAGML